MTQLSLVDDLEGLDASSSRADRMGAVERLLWRGPTAAGVDWRWTDDGWVPPEGPAQLALIGVDEAGRGPLAGPVSVATVLVEPGGFEGAPWLEQLDDSKKVTEETRAELFQRVIELATGWSIVHVHNGHIDRVNILRATFHGMCMATEALLGLEGEVWPQRPSPCIMVRADSADPAWYQRDLRPGGVDAQAHMIFDRPGELPTTRRAVCVLVDGNKRFKVPGAQAAGLMQKPIVKGDGLSWHIAAASILAKVSRDAVMERLGELFPAYGFGRHKGYPTPEHRAALATDGPCSYHRMSFRGAKSASA